MWSSSIDARVHCYEYINLFFHFRIRTLHICWAYRDLSNAKARYPLCMAALGVRKGEALRVRSNHRLHVVSSQELEVMKRRNIARSRE